MSDRNDRTSDSVMHPDDECRPVAASTCTQAWCQGKMLGVGEGYLECSVCGTTVDAPPAPRRAGEVVWVRATVKQVRPERDGFIDLDVQDYYYVSDDALDASDVEEIYIRVPANHVRPATG